MKGEFNWNPEVRQDLRTEKVLLVNWANSFTKSEFHRRLINDKQIAAFHKELCRIYQTQLPSFILTVSKSVRLAAKYSPEVEELAEKIRGAIQSRAEFIKVSFLREIGYEAGELSASIKPCSRADEQADGGPQ